MRRFPLALAGLALAPVVSLAGCDRLLPERPAVAVAPPASETAPTPSPRTPARPAAPAEADTAAPVPGVTESQAFAQIRRALQRLVAAEQGFYAENGVYTEDMDRLGYRPVGQTSVRFLWLNRDGWAVSGTHPAIPKRDCVIFVGRVNAPPTTLKFVRTARHGVPACDEPPRPQRAEAGAPPAPAPTDTGSAIEAVDPALQMRVDLRNLVTAQQAYLQTQGLYSRRFEPFALQYLWHRGVNVRILTADAESWSASARHESDPGKSCVMYWGPVKTRPFTAAEGKMPQKPGVSVCDG